MKVFDKISFEKIEDRKIILIFVLISLIIEMILFPLVTTEETQDSYWMMTLGQNFVNGNGYTLFNKPHDAFAPLFPVSMGVLSLVTGDIHFAGKIVSMLFLLGSISFVYLIWKELSGKKVATLATGVYILFPMISEFGVRIMTESTFTFFVVSSIYLLLKSRNNSKFLPLLGLSLGLSILARYEGIMLTATCILGMILGKRKLIHKGRKPNFSGIKRIITNKYFILSIIIILSVTVPWFYRNYEEIGSVIISKYNADLMERGHEPIGIGFITITLLGGLGPVFLLLSVAGIYLMFKLGKWKEIFPILIFIILYSAMHMNFFQSYIRYSHPLIPFFAGFSAIAVFYIFSYAPKKIKEIEIAPIIISLLIVALLGIPVAWFSTSDHGNNYDAVKKTMEWINENSKPNDLILAGDGEPTYGFYTNRTVVGFDEARYFSHRIFLEMPKTIENAKDLSFFVYLARANISYFVPYDSRMQWFYDGFTKHLADNFAPVRQTFGDGVLTLNPVGRIESGDQFVYLYEVEFSEK